jgi:hypothetical protein
VEKSFWDDILELAKEKKAYWEKRIQQIEAEMKTESKSSYTSKKGGRPRSSKTARAEKKIIEILQNTEKPLSPKDIGDKSKVSGMELKPNIVRQILSRGKGTTFISPEHALWKLKEKQ